ncbi:MAG: hypothetical protein GF375_01620, partial [Candidatus Omnitrophica bacterium]|nr:hypothetical protein [Candidatus Omnitrophota bacterium]MBD3268825.1 hypothetical protein [Candidatus Omnitrophota bacterium]
MKYKNLLLLVTGLLFCFTAGAAPQDSYEYVKKGWSLLGKGEFEEVYRLTDECIEKFSQKADILASGLESFPSKGEEDNYAPMNNVATCYFIKGETLIKEGKTDEAKKVFETVIEKYPYAQSFDPRGWYWSIKEKAEMTLNKLETGRVEEAESEEDVVITRVTLYDKGDEFPVDYEKYGKFLNEGKKNYKFVIKNPIGLSDAVGEGIYPNS